VDCAAVQFASNQMQSVGFKGVASDDILKLYDALLNPMVRTSNPIGQCD
jgi:hypothetical protein